MNGFRKLALLAASALCGVGCATTTATAPRGPVHAIDCDEVGRYASESDDERFEIVFRNSRATAVDIYWIDYDGEEELRTSLSAGDSWPQITYVTHPWVVRTKSGHCLAAYRSASRVFVDIQ